MVGRNANRKRKSWILNHLLTPVGFTPIVSVDFSGPEWSIVVFRGNYPAKIDEKGRLKIPAMFRTIMQDRYGSQVFVTSHEDQGAAVHIYPLPVWAEMERGLAPVWENKLALVSAEERKRQEALEQRARRVNYYGQSGEIDKQGRVSIHLLLRESAAMDGDVAVVGQFNHLEVWNRERLATRMVDQAAAGGDAQEPSERGA